jgi:cardiolipin synthase
MIARMQAATPRVAAAYVPALMATLGVAAVGVVAGLAGCATAPVVPLPPTASATAAAGAPRAAWLMPGRVMLAYERPGGDTFLEATWLPVLSHAVAQLDLAAVAPNLDATPAPRPVRLRERADWDALLREVFTDLAPADPGQATLVVVQGVDVVFHRDAAGVLHTYRHERKPAELTVVRTLDEQAFARTTIAHLAARTGVTEPVLFATGDPDTGAGFVLFDGASGQSVLIAPAAAPDPAAALGAVGISLDFAQALLLQSHVVAPIMRPFASTERFLTHAAQSAIAVVPRPAGGTGPAPPLAGGAAMDLATFERELDRLVDSPRVPGRIRLLIDGDAFFTRFVQALQDARGSVDIRVYIFDRDAFALAIADLVKARSREIRVRVLLDELGTIGAGADASRTPHPHAAAYATQPPSIASYLREGADVDVRALANPFLTSDHTKVLLFDGERAFVGGMNIGHQYRYLWHDLMVELEGPVVSHLARDFELAFRRADLVPSPGAGRPPDAPPAQAAPGMADLRLLYTRPADPQILRAQLAAIRAARREILIEQAYVSDDEIVAALVAARRRGVDVRVILPTRGDSGFMNSANLIATRAFVANGVRVFAYPGMTHVKAAIYDGWAIVGSANFDKLSLRVNGETCVATSDPAFVATLRRELFDRDFARATEVTAPPAVGWTTYIADFVADQL